MRKSDAKELAESIAKGWTVTAGEQTGRKVLKGKLAGQLVVGVGDTWDAAAIEFAADYESRKLDVLSARAHLKTAAGKVWILKRWWRIAKETVREAVPKLRP